MLFRSEIWAPMSSWAPTLSPNCEAHFYKGQADHLVRHPQEDRFEVFCNVRTLRFDCRARAVRSGSVCLNNFPRTISGALGVHNSAELSTAADGACDVPADAVGNSGRTNKFHSMRPLPILAGSHSRPHPAFDSPGWSVAVPCCTNQCGVRSGSVHQPRWHRHACTHART